MTIANTALYRTTTGKRLHIAECPHVLGAALHEADADDLAVRELCTWCDAELSEEGRTYHDSIEDALRFMGVAECALPELSIHLRTASHDDVYTPFSRAYVSLLLEGRSVAWARKTYVGFRDGRLVTLPDYVPGTGTSRGGRDDVWGETCLVHFVRRSVTGVCGGCL